MGVPTPLPTPVLFPFEPDATSPVVEKLLWVTDVIPGQDNSEFRQSLRIRPAMTLSWLVTVMDRSESDQLASLLFSNVDSYWYVPMWQMRRTITGIAGGVYSYTGTGARFVFSSKAVVWSSSGLAQVMSVSASTDGTVTLVEAPAFDHKPGMMIIPLGIGTLNPERSHLRADVLASFQAEFDIDTTNTTPLAPGEPTLLLDGVEVLNIHPVSENGTSQENWIQASERVGTTLGPFVQRPLAPTPVSKRPLEWYLDGYDEVAAFRAWLFARRGRRQPLWMPTYQQDLTLVADVPAGQDFLDIVDCNFTGRYLPYPIRTRVVLLQSPVSVLPFKVSGVTIPTAGVERLALTAPVAVDILASTRLSFLVYARLQDDSVSLSYDFEGHAMAQAAFQELPQEVPA